VRVWVEQLCGKYWVVVVGGVKMQHNNKEFFIFVVPYIINLFNLLAPEFDI
jgi:hypothetical protein